jgi:MFS family permease
LLSAVLISRIGPVPPEGGGTRPGWRSIAEGLRFLKERRILQANFAIDLNAMIFGMPSALFPAIGTTLLGGDASTVGLLYAAPGIGALAAALTSGWVATIRRQGRAVMTAVIVWGLAITAFGLTRSVGVAMTMLAVAGGADVISAVFRNTILQMSVPDSLRGRLSGIHIAVVSGGPRLGDFEAGAVAGLVSVPFSVVSGGVACILGALVIARRMPELPRYVDRPASTPAS